MEQMGAVFCMSGTSLLSISPALWATVQLDNVIQQNASSSEEMSSTSEELSSQAEMLQSAISYFRLNGGNGHAKSSTTACCPSRRVTKK